MKIGRNDICPCGSGKKYKKCCGEYNLFDKNGSLNPKLEKDDYFSFNDKIDYGKPVLTDDFFSLNSVHDISAPRLIYSCLINPEIESYASNLSNSMLGRGANEARIIDSTNSIDGLIEIMKGKTDPLNHERLKNKMLQYKEQAVPRLISELRKETNDAFVELAARIIHLSKINCADDIINLIKNGPRKAYLISIECLLLGFYERNDVLKILWDYYHFFKEKYPDKTYSDGPLIGLIETRERRKDEISKN